MTSETREQIARIIAPNSWPDVETGGVVDGIKRYWPFSWRADSLAKADAILALLPPAAGSATEPGPLDGWARRLFPDRLPADVLSGVTELSNAIEIELFGLLMNNQIEGRTIAASIEIAEAILSKFGTPLVDSSLRDGWPDADVERMARAQYDALGYGSWSGLGALQQQRQVEAMRAALSAIGAPSEGGGEQAWLIEISGPKWFAAGPKWNWTTDANEALRFSRKADAERFAQWGALSAAVGEPLQCTEHIWPSPRSGEDESAPSEVKP